MALSTRRNEITGTVSALGSPEFFAIAAVGGTLGVDSEAIVRHLLGLEDNLPEVDVNGDRRVTAADIVFNERAD